MGAAFQQGIGRLGNLAKFVSLAVVAAAVLMLATLAKADGVSSQQLDLATPKSIVMRSEPQQLALVIDRTSLQTAPAFSALASSAKSSSTPFLLSLAVTPVSSTANPTQPIMLATGTFADDQSRSSLATPSSLHLLALGLVLLLLVRRFRLIPR